MREYYYLTGLEDSPYDLTIAEALHLAATHSGLEVYVYIDESIFLQDLSFDSEMDLKKDRGFFIKLSPLTITTFEKMLFKGESAFEKMFGSDDPERVSLDFAFIDERYSGSIPIGSPFHPKPDSSFRVTLYADNPNFYPTFEAVPTPSISLSDLLCWTEDIEELAKRGRIKRRADGQTTSTNPDADRLHYPPHLEALTIAWRKYWQNADPTDRTACPKKPDVVAWLIDQGFSAKNADAGATIIKPQWAIDKGW